MRHTVLGAVFALSVSAVLSSGCGSGAPPSANSLTKVYTEVIQPTCSSVYCHYYGVGIQYSALDMSSKVKAYWSLVDMPCMGPPCSGVGMRVVPGDPDSSIMYQKLSAATVPCGKQMPADTEVFLTQGNVVFSGTELPADQKQLIHDWIYEGAYDN